MDTAENLILPNIAEEATRASPLIVAVSAVIGALAAAESLVSPRRIQLAMAVAETTGALLGEPLLVRMLTLGALSAPVSPHAALAQLKPAVAPLASAERAALMQELKLLVGSDAKPTVAALAPELAATLGVPVPAELRQEGAGLRGAFGSLADRAARLVWSEDHLLTAVRAFALEFGEGQLIALADQAYRTGDRTALLLALGCAVDAVRDRLAAIDQAVEAHQKAQGLAEELSTAANTIERVSRQRYAAVVRRATLLKRHIRQDLEALVEDAAEEFEVDFRRFSEQKKGLFGTTDTADLNDRMVVKNLERRYQHLARRYQDELDLFDREVSEFGEEFTRIGDEALAPVARHAFRTMAPHPALALRVKAAADRASTRVLGAGAVGAAGAAVHASLVGVGVMAGVAAAPVGAAALGVIALAGAWKMFAAPTERRRRDLRERTQGLREKLREEMMGKLPQFEVTVDAIVERFHATVVPDIMLPRLEAERIRRVAAAHQTVARGVRMAADARIQGLIAMTGELHGSEQTAR